jgi:hypothetical protein
VTWRRPAFGRFALAGAGASLAVLAPGRRHLVEQYHGGVEQYHGGRVHVATVVRSGLVAVIERDGLVAQVSGAALR